MRRRIARSILHVAVMTACLQLHARSLPPMQNALPAVPPGFSLHYFDDCGVEGRQPHFRMEDAYFFTFSTSDNDADLKARTAVFSYKKLVAQYDDLDPARAYVVAVTYASDQVYKRVQSMWADGVEIHPPYPLPNGRAGRHVFRLPAGVTRDGKMTLEWRIHGEVNATVSVVEVWSDGPPPASLRIAAMAPLADRLEGQVTGLDYEPRGGARVVLRRPGESGALLESVTDAGGWFGFERARVESAREGRELEVAAVGEGQEAVRSLPAAARFFDPVTFRPLPSRVGGLKQPVLSLDGRWRIHTTPLETTRTQPLDAPGWGDFDVPGQWKQQGYDVPQDRPVVVARTFAVPAEWKGSRVILRFDALHGGTRAFLNGRELGYSERLFTPVEYDATEAARPGEINRLDLVMTVDTPSERLAYASAYAFHSLGGIPRSVRLFALPPAHIRSLRLSADLDAQYRDGVLHARLTVTQPSTLNPQPSPSHGLSVSVSLRGPDGRTVKAAQTEVAGLSGGDQAVELSVPVARPRAWSAEKPHLYRAVIELKQESRTLERIERAVGFRRIEVKGRQLYVNGQVVKLAGACRHEVNPLKGRADTARYAEEDVRLLKQANLNYIRGTHYPPTPELAEAADRLGMYLEVEAPFCWVGPSDDLAAAHAVLDPTAAMVDFYGGHPSVVLWSIANESHMNRLFAYSLALVKKLDPQTPTTFNHAMGRADEAGGFDILNLHYPAMPYDAQEAGDPRPFLMGEYLFPVCHEQTDVRIDPGLRELWGHGHAEPDSAWGRECAENYDRGFFLPGAKSGFWDHIQASERLVGGAIFAATDDSFYFPDGSHAGYSWVHGYWGLLDAWRRPKPEWFLCRWMFAPVWFPHRTLPFAPGQRALSIPVENRYSFTDLKELRFAWEIGGRSGTVRAAMPPRSRGEVRLPLPPGAREGDRVRLRVTDRAGTLVNVADFTLGAARPEPPSAPSAGPPEWEDDGRSLVVRGEGWSLVVDRAAGDLAPGDSRHHAPLSSFPRVHVTRHDFGDLAGPNAPPYAVFPDAGMRVVERVTARETPEGLEIAVQDRYAGFAGTTRLALDRKGVGRIRYDYDYSGDDLQEREVGVKLLLAPACDTLHWRRWSEWGWFPEESISRTEGTAKATRTGKREADAEHRPPSWPWKDDQTELGTADFRSVKLNVYEAALQAADGSGLQVHADGRAHVRACLDDRGVLLHVLSRCRMAPQTIRKGEKIAGEVAFRLLPGR